MKTKRETNFLRGELPEDVLTLLMILGLVLIVMKVTGDTDLLWVWVLAPFWGPYALVLVAHTIRMTGLTIYYEWKLYKIRRRRKLEELEIKKPQ